MMMIMIIIIIVSAHGFLLGQHLFPSAKLTFSSQWLSQDISLFLHEIALSPNPNRNPNQMIWYEYI